MKHLVLGALFAVTASVGCTTDDDPPLGTASVVTVGWTFKNLESMSARSCPSGFSVAEVVSQATDPTTYLPTGTVYHDTYDCSDGVGDVVLPDEDTYIVWVEIKSSSGAPYATSEEFYVDTLDPSDTLRRDTEILDDGGYFTLTWDLKDAVTSAPLSCNAAQADDIHVLTTMTSSGGGFDDVFDCGDHFATTPGLLAGDYTVAITAEDNGGPLGDQVLITNKRITAPNGLTPLGHVVLPID
jgi:hypothetical protein